MKKINIILAALVILFTTSCEGFLNVPPSNQGDSSTSIQTVADAKVMMNGLMSKLAGSSYYGRNFPMYADAKGGDFTTFSAGNGGDGWYYFNHEHNNNSYEGYWSTMYNCLLQTNNIITNLRALLKDPEVKGASDLEELLGEALTIRALIHFDLVRLYGKPYNMDKGASWGVAVVTEAVDARAQLKRNTVAETYTQILKDLVEAEPIIGKAKNNGFINYYGHQALLSKVYMYMDNYKDALTAAEKVINSGVYTLYTNSNWVESWSRQFGSESIFELNVVQNEADLGTGSPGCYYRRRGHGISAGGVFLASDIWMNIMGANDIRWGIMDEDQASDEEAQWAGRMGACYKLSGSTDLDGDGKGSSTAVNVKVMRLSEVYLNAAECALRTNDQAKAKEYLSAIAKRNPDWTVPGTVTAEDVMTERRRELMCEGVVYFEYMRQNMTISYDDNLFGKGNVPSSAGRGSQPNATVNRSWHKTILPIGQHELNSNPDIQQNDGYKK